MVRHISLTLIQKDHTMDIIISEIKDERGNVVECHFKQSVFCKHQWFKRTFDERGNILSHETSGGHKWTCTYNDNNQPLSYADSFGITQLTTYHANGNEATSEQHDADTGYWIKHTYNADGTETSCTSGVSDCECVNSSKSL